MPEDNNQDQMTDASPAPEATPTEGEAAAASMSQDQHDTFLVQSLAIVAFAAFFTSMISGSGLAGF